MTEFISPYDNDFLDVLVKSPFLRSGLVSRFICKWAVLRKFGALKFEPKNQSPFPVLYHIFAIIFIFPFRLLGLLTFGALALFLTLFLSHIEPNPERSRMKEYSAFTRFICWLEKKTLRWFNFFSYGLVWISLKGQPDPKAKVSIAAPHSTLLFAYSA